MRIGEECRGYEKPPRSEEAREYDELPRIKERTDRKRHYKVCVCSYSSLMAAFTQARWWARSPGWRLARKKDSLS
jgi:hypothetical protein